MASEHELELALLLQHFVYSIFTHPFEVRYSTVQCVCMC